MNFTYPTIGKLFKNRIDLSGNITPYPLEDTTDNINIEKKKWRISFKVKNKQDVKQQPHLIVTKALNGLSVQTLDNLFFNSSTGSYNLVQKIYNHNIQHRIGSSGSRDALAAWNYYTSPPKVLTETNKNNLKNYNIDLASFNYMGYIELIYSETLYKTDYYKKYITANGINDIDSFIHIINGIQIINTTNINKDSSNNTINITDNIKNKLNNSFFYTLLILNSVKDPSGNKINSATLKTVKDIFYYLREGIDSDLVNYTFHEPTDTSYWPQNYNSPFSYILPSRTNLDGNLQNEAAIFIDSSANINALMSELAKYDIDTQLLIENAMNEAKAIAKINSLTRYQDASNNIFKLTEIIYETAKSLDISGNMVPIQNPIDPLITNMLGGEINQDQAVLTKSSSSYTAASQFLKGYDQMRGKTSNSVKIITIIDKLVRNARIFRDVILIASNHISLNDLTKRDLTTLIPDRSVSFNPNVIKVDLIKNTIVIFMNQIIESFGVLFNPRSSDKQKIGSLIIVFCTIIVSLAQIINSIMSPESSVNYDNNPEAELAALVFQIQAAALTPSWVSEAIVMLNICSFVCGDILTCMKENGGAVDYTGYTYGCPNPIELGASATNIGNDIASLVSTTDPLKLFFKALLVGSDVLDFVLLIMRGGNWDPLKWIAGLIEDEMRELGEIMLPFGMIFVDGYLEVTSFIDKDNVLRLLSEGKDEFYGALTQNFIDEPEKFLKIVNQFPDVKVGLTTLKNLFDTKDARYALDATLNFLTKDLGNGFKNEIINPIKRIFRF